MKISISIEPFLADGMAQLPEYLTQITTEAVKNPDLSLHFDYFRENQTALKLVQQCFGKIDVYAHLMNDVVVPNAGFKAVSRDVKEVKSITSVQQGVVLDLGCDVVGYENLIKDAQYVTIMAVKCGQSGQTFHPEVLALVPKIRQINPKCVLTIDGGVNESNLAMIEKAGIDIAVVGSFAKKAFESGNFAQIINRLLHV